MAVKGSCTFCTHSMTVRRLFPPGVRPALPSSPVYCTTVAILYRPSRSPTKREKEGEEDVCRQCREEEGGGEIAAVSSFSFRPSVRPFLSPFLLFPFPPPFGHFPYGSDVPRLGNEEEEEEGKARPTFTFPPPTFLATFPPLPLSCPVC